MTNKQHILGCLRAEGPCDMERLEEELLVQAIGEWDVPYMRPEARQYHARLAVVDALNELVREGKAVLDESGDAWDVNYEEGQDA